MERDRSETKMKKEKSLHAKTNAISASWQKRIEDEQGPSTFYNVVTDTFPVCCLSFSSFYSIRRKLLEI